jgi:hypothetical protein
VGGGGFVEDREELLGSVAESMRLNGAEKVEDRRARAPQEEGAIEYDVGNCAFFVAALAYDICGCKLPF